MTATLFAVEFREACTGGLCPFCVVADHRTRQYLSSLLYEYVTSPATHSRLSESRGLCGDHAQVLLSVAKAERPDGVPVAVFFESVVRALVAEMAEELEGTVPGRRPSAGGRAARRLGARQPCPVCERAKASEEYSRAVFLDALREGENHPLVREFVRNGAICIRHLVRLLRDAPTGDAARWLIEQAREQYLRLGDQLETLIEKHSLDHRGEHLGPERLSWIRALELCNGPDEA